MLIHPRGPVLLAALVLLAAPIAAQEAAPTDSKIVEVTLYSSRARVTREVPLPAATGVHTVRIEPLPASLIDGGVQAEGAAHHRVLSVQIERRSGGDQASPEFRALEARIEGLAAERNAIARRHEAARARRERFASLEVVPPPRPEGESAPSRVDPPSWERFIELVVRGMSSAASAMAELEEDLATRDRELAALREELAELGAPGRRESAAAIVAVQDLTGAGGMLRLSYEMPLALWYPEYAVRIDAAARRFEITAYGVVHQRTGEEWPEVPIRFSTSVPEQGADLPELASLRIRRERYAEPERGLLADAPREEIVRAGARARGLLEGEGRKELAGLDDPSAPAAEGEPSFGRVMRLNQFNLPAKDARRGESPFSDIPDECILPAESSRGFLRVFASARPEAVPSDGAPHRLLIARIEIPFLEERVCIPELAEQVFRRVRAALPGDDPLLAGSAAVFLDGAYLGESRIPTTAPAEEIALDLGVDERIAVVRRQEDREEDVGVFSKGRRYLTEVTVTLRNHHPEAKSVEVRERIPFSEQERITVELDRRRTAPPPDRWRESSGILGWDIAIPPGEERTITILHRIGAPRDFQLTLTSAPERAEDER